MDDYKKSEPICIIFPSNRSSILKDISCDILATGGLDPRSVSFHGLLDQDGTPLTWLPAELTIAGQPVYSSADVSDLGFISLGTRIPCIVPILYYALIVGAPLGFAFEPFSVEQMVLYLIYLALILSIWMDFWVEEIVIRRKRSADGVNFMISRSGKSDKPEVVEKHHFELEGPVSKPREPSVHLRF